ncbi:MAG: excinuclease ABC subunit UvrA, partial [Chloroflexota bacterium]
MQIDPALVIPDRTKSIAQGAIEPWSKSPSVAGWYLRQLEALAEDQRFTIHTPIEQLTEPQLQALLYGTGDRLLRLRFTNQYGRTQVYDTRYEGVIPNLQ